MASLNVPYNDPLLIPYGANASSNIPPNSNDTMYFRDARNVSIITGIRSPFVIALVRAGYNKGLQGFVHVCVFFAALTAA